MRSLRGPEADIDGYRLVIVDKWRRQLARRAWLDLMLADSGLVASQDATTGAFAVRKVAAGHGDEI